MLIVRQILKSCPCFPALYLFELILQLIISLAEVFVHHSSHHLTGQFGRQPGQKLVGLLIALAGKQVWSVLHKDTNKRVK